MPLQQYGNHAIQGDLAYFRRGNKSTKNFLQSQFTNPSVDEGSVSAVHTRSCNTDIPAAADQLLQA